MAAAKDAQVAAEVGQRHESVLSNIMLPGQQSGQIASAESLNGKSAYTPKETTVNLGSDQQNVTDQAASANGRSSNPNYAFSQASGAQGTMGVQSNSSGRLEQQGLTPDTHLAHGTQLEATPASRAAAPLSSTEVAGPGSPTPGDHPEANHAPIPTVAIADQAATEDAGFSFTVPTNSFVDVDAGDHLTLSATLADGSPLPAWLVFDAATGTFSGTPANDDVGDLAVRITATDTSGATAVQDFDITVANTNDAPVASVVIADQAAGEDSAFSFTVATNSFTDVDVGDHLSLSATLADGSPLPTWLVFDAATGTFSGTPVNEDVGDVAVRVTATDTSGATATQNFDITVANTNDAPVASVIIPDQSASEDAGFSFTVAANSFTDVDVGDHLALSATLADGSPLPTWLVFDAATGTFSGTPANEDVGDIAIRVTATDDSGVTAIQNFDIAVANTNDAPVASVTIADQSATEDAGFNFTVPSTSFTDVDVGDHLSLSATLADGSPLPTWLVFDAATGTFSGTPANDDVGDVAVRVTATDDAGATATQNFDIAVANTNDAPVASVTIADQSATEDAGFSFTVATNSFADVDVGDHLSLSATLADGGPLPTWLVFDAATGTFSGTPANEDVGDVAVRVTATDDAGATAIQNFDIAVANTNDAPVASVTIADQSTTEDAGFSFTVTTNSFTDVDAGDHLSLSATLADGSPLPTWLVFDAATGTFSGTPANEDVGDVAVRVTATDTSGATATQNFDIAVANTNDAPIASVVIADQAASEDSGFSFTVANNSFTDVDVGDHLSLSATLADGSPLPTWLVFDAATGTFSGTPANEDVGDVAVRVTATDTSGATATQNFDIAVANTNDAPVVTSSDNASFSENSTGTVYTATATDVDAGTTLTYSLSGDDAALFNIDADTGAVTFKSAPNYEAPADHGGNNIYDVTVTASDGITTVSQAVAITVANVDEAPTFTSGTAAAIAENGTGIAYQAAATDPDAGATLTYTLSGTDATLFNIDAATGAVSFKSAPNFEAPTDTGGNNVYDVTVKASDGSNTTSQDVAITVTNVNEAPTIASTAGSPGVTVTPISEIVLHVSGDQYLGSPIMQVTVDGTVVGTYTITADHRAGAWQDITISGNFGSAGPSSVQVAFTNDAYAGTSATDRNLVVDNIVVNGVTFQAEAADYHVGSTVYHGYETMLWQGHIDFQTSGSPPP